MSKRDHAPSSRSVSSASSYDAGGSKLEDAPSAPCRPEAAPREVSERLPSSNRDSQPRAHRTAEISDLQRRLSYLTSAIDDTLLASGIGKKRNEQPQTADGPRLTLSAETAQAAADTISPGIRRSSARVSSEERVTQIFAKSSSQHSPHPARPSPPLSSAVVNDAPALEEPKVPTKTFSLVQHKSTATAHIAPREVVAPLSNFGTAGLGAGHDPKAKVSDRLASKPSQVVGRERGRDERKPHHIGIEITSADSQHFGAPNRPASPIKLKRKPTVSPPQTPVTEGNISILAPEQGEVVVPPPQRPRRLMSPPNDAHLATRSTSPPKALWNQRDTTRMPLTGGDTIATLDRRSHSELDALLTEEREVRLRVEALKRIEQEKRELLTHQQRLLELDMERKRVEEERRRCERDSVERRQLERSRERSVEGGKLAKSSPPSRVAEMRAKSPPVASPRELERARRKIELNSSSTDDDLVAMSTRRRGRSGNTTLGNPAAYASSSRSPSPLAFQHHQQQQNLSTSYQSMSSPMPSLDNKDPRLPHRLLMVSEGIHAAVITGRNRSVAARAFLSEDLKELLVLPFKDGLQEAQESHHFPLTRASVLYPNAIVQKQWMPQQVHIRGVVMGNRARSILISKGCPYFVATDAASRHRVYLIVGGDAYAPESTLLVLQMPNRFQFCSFLLGVHAAMWPNGKPPLSRGRLLWFIACYAVLQQYWEGNQTADTLFQQQQRRRNSKERSARGDTPHITVDPKNSALSFPNHTSNISGVAAGEIAGQSAKKASNRFALPNQSTMGSVVTTLPGQQPTGQTSSQRQVPHNQPPINGTSQRLPQPNSGFFPRNAIALKQLPPSQQPQGLVATSRSNPKAVFQYNY